MPPEEALSEVESIPKEKNGPLKRRTLLSTFSGGHLWGAPPPLADFYDFYKNKPSSKASQLTNFPNSSNPQRVKRALSQENKN